MARPAPGRATVYRPMFTCPACHRAVTARLTLEIGIADDAAPVDGQFQPGEIETRLTGLTVDHDCAPPVGRGGQS